MTKKTLYQVLQVARNANLEVISAAYQTRLQALGNNAAPEIVAERTLLREAYELLSDPVRRKLYDDKLREEYLNLQAQARGGEVVRPRAAAVQPASADEPSSSPLGWMIGMAVLGLVVVIGGWIYLDDKHKTEALRIEKERRAEELRLKEAASENFQQTVDWAKQRIDKDRQAAEARARAAQDQRERAQWQMEQERYAYQQRAEAQRAAAEQRQAEYEQQRIEQENLRRQQIQLERDRRLLQELERSSPRRF